MSNKFGQTLIELRKLYDAKKIDDEAFIDAVNTVYETLKGVSTDFKVKVFDAMAEFWANEYAIEELNDGVAWEGKNSQYYTYETFVKAAFGTEIFSFMNDTYESG